MTDEGASALRDGAVTVEVIARQLNRLFARSRRTGGRKHTDEELAHHVRDVTETACSRYWISSYATAR